MSRTALLAVILAGLGPALLNLALQASSRQPRTDATAVLPTTRTLVETQFAVNFCHRLQNQSDVTRCLAQHIR